MEQISQKLGSVKKIMAVVKSNAYGNGDLPIVERLISNGVDKFAVSTIEEAIRIRKFFPDVRILILGYTSPDFCPSLEKYDLEQTLVSLQHAKSLAEKCTGTLRVHLAIDSGMTRFGIDPAVESVDSAIEEIQKLKQLRLIAIFTHLSVSDSIDKDDCDFTDAQLDCLRDLKNRYPMYEYHCLNSAGVVTRDNEFDYARPGSILYGFDPIYPLPNNLDLIPILSLKSRITNIKDIPAGRSIGYCRTSVSKAPMRIAVVSAGYSDGYPRALSNNQHVLVRGEKANIVGLICMNDMMIDVTSIENAEVGDVVTLIGSDGPNKIGMEEVAGKCYTIPDEIITTITAKVPRIYKR